MSALDPLLTLRVVASIMRMKSRAIIVAAIALLIGAGGGWLAHAFWVAMQRDALSANFPDDLAISCARRDTLAAALGSAQALKAEGKSVQAAAIASFALSHLGNGYLDPEVLDDTGLHLGLGQSQLRNGDDVRGATMIVGVLASRLGLLEDACRKHAFPQP